MSNSGIEDFERADDDTLMSGMKIAAKLGLIVAVHAESEEITSNLTNEIQSKGQPYTWDDYLASRPIAAEVEAINRAIAIAAETGCRLHIVHVSSAEGAEIVRQAVAQGSVDVTCETCPHYLAMTIHDLEGLGAVAKCAPPLRSPGDVSDLWQALADGKFAFVGSDHSPSPASMKTGNDPFSMWGGIAGVQSTLSILLSRGHRLSLPRIAYLLATGAADRFGIKHKGKIEIGCDADFALVDVDDQYELTREMLLDRHKLSPYVGRTFQGIVHRTIVRGNTVFQDGKTVGDFRGQLIKGAAHA
jgi:allantoinase